MKIDYKLIVKDFWEDLRDEKQTSLNFKDWLFEENINYTIKECKDWLEDGGLDDNLENWMRQIKKQKLENKKK